MPQDYAPFFRSLREIIPPDRLLVEETQLAAYASDGLTIFSATPKAVVLPESQGEVVDVVRLCAAHKVPFVARGSGTSLSGGAVPVEEGIVIALNRLTRILEMDPARRVAIVEPGVVNLAVTTAAQPHGLHFAPDPSSQQICTIGGNVAFNSGGAHCLKYGMTSNHVLGLKIVTATGDILDFGGPSLESVGPDLTGLFVGSEGLFGIALEITLRLLPRAEVFHTVLASYAHLEEAGNAVSAVIASGLLPGALEIMDKLAMQAAEAAVGAGYPEDAEAVLIVELEGTREQVDADKVRLESIIRDSAPTRIHVAGNMEERAAIWKGRKSAFSAVGRLSPDFIVQDGVVPRRRLGEALREIGEIALRHKVRVANVFHAGDGNLHPLIMFDGREAGAFERGEDCAAEILRLCVRMGGSITGEHGIGMEKRAFLPAMFGADDIAVFTVLRHAFDPEEIANPGKMFPAAEAPALTMTGLHPLEKEGIISRE